MHLGGIFNTPLHQITCPTQWDQVVRDIVYNSLYYYYRLSESLTAKYMLPLTASTQDSCSAIFKDDLMDEFKMIHLFNIMHWCRSAVTLSCWWENLLLIDVDIQWTHCKIEVFPVGMSIISSSQSLLWWSIWWSIKISNSELLWISLSDVPYPSLENAHSQPSDI